MTNDLKYTEEADVDFDSYSSPDGESQTGYVTRPLSRGDLFGDAVYELVRQELEMSYGDPGDLLITTTACWSGYSEYTITNTWSEITITSVARNYEKTWPSVGDFLRAVAGANPEADR